MQLIIISILSITAIGLVCALFLALGARFFHIDEDPRVAAITDILPGANCGACGFAGCANYAEWLVGAGQKPSKCPVADSQTIAKIAEMLGLEAPADVARKVALVLCGGSDDKAPKRFEYNGIIDCAAAAATAGGDKACTYGCLGYGSCVRVCPSNAISIENGLARVHPELCISCEQCVAACPRGIIKMVPSSSTIHVLCSSKAKGAEVRKACSVGCIGCRICAKLSDGAIEMDGALAVVNYDKPLDNEMVVEKCPVKCIVKSA